MTWATWLNWRARAVARATWATLRSQGFPPPVAVQSVTGGPSPNMRLWRTIRGPSTFYAAATSFVDGTEFIRLGDETGTGGTVVSAPPPNPDAVLKLQQQYESGTPLRIGGGSNIAGPALGVTSFVVATNWGPMTVAQTPGGLLGQPVPAIWFRVAPPEAYQGADRGDRMRLDRPVVVPAQREYVRQDASGRTVVPARPAFTAPAGVYALARAAEGGVGGAYQGPG